MKEDNNKQENQETENNNEEETAKELDKLIKNLEEEQNIDPKTIKILKVERPSLEQMRRKRITGALVMLVFDLFLLVALNGYLKFADFDLLKFVIFGLSFFAFEFLFKWLLQKYYPKLIMYSFGAIMIPLTVIALVIAELISGLKIEDSDKLIIFYILFIVVRFALRYLLMRKEIKAMMEGRKK